jgi:hypothetical protein
MKGCVLYGRLLFSNQAKNPPIRRRVRNKAEVKAVDPAIAGG